MNGLHRASLHLPTRTMPKNIVIIGGGIAGSTTAYYLSQSTSRSPDTKITIVEGTKIAAAASGYSGGFLAKDWHGSATSSLAALSFDLHAKLAKQYGGAEKWGYRTVDTLSIETDATRTAKRQTPVKWLPQGLVHMSRSLGTHSTTAQVHPRLFTTFIADQFTQAPNTSIVIGTAVSLCMSSNESGSSTFSPTGVKVRLQSGEEEVLPADVVVITAGPWTGQVAIDLLGNQIGRRLGVSGHRAHSIVLKTKEQLTPHCLFTNMRLEDDSVAEPEVYARPDGTTYICGAGDSEPLPATAAEVKPSPISIEKLKREAAALSSVFSEEGGVEVQAEQACYLPIADRGRPLIGKVRGVEGVYVGSGLTCWGITFGPGTGCLLAEMILNGTARSADISKLAP
ncbi:putative cytoplasm protein, partial [Kockovaella imperatae]